MVEESNLNIIKCPYCGCEYLPGEIYVPNELVGQPVDIERTADHRIQFAFGKKQDLNETYTCDACNRTFKVKCNMSFETSYCDELNFDDDFTAPLYGTDRLTLKEE